MEVHSVQEYLLVLKKIHAKYSEKTNCGGDDLKIPVEFCYRGICNKEYKLCPRAINQTLCEIPYQSFDLPVEHFRKEASGYLRNICGEDKLLWMQYAQHFGVPTRLLDFTTNPLVALYFACQNTAEDGAVWVIQSDNYVVTEIFRYMGEKGLGQYSSDDFYKVVFQSDTPEDISPAFFTPEYIDARMSAQSSRFMLWPNCRFNLEDRMNDNMYMNLTKEDETAIEKQGQYALRLIVPMKSKKSMIKDLDMLGVNEKTLFPGVDSIGRYIDYKFNPKMR